MVIIEIINEAANADQKLLTSSRSLHLAVNINIAALITKANKPSESRIAGSVKSFTREPMKPLINPNNAATQR